MPARAKKVPTSDITAVIGLRRVTVKMARPMAMPARRMKITVSAGPALPSIRCTSRSSCGGLLHLRLELAAELGEEAEHRPGGRLAEGTDRVAGDADGDVGEQVDVARAPLALHQA